MPAWGLRIYSSRCQPPRTCTHTHTHTHKHTHTHNPPTFTHPNALPRFIQSVAADSCHAYSFQGAIMTGPTSGPPPLKNTGAPGQAAKWEEYQRRFDYMYDAGDWQPFGCVGGRRG
mgnify:CR=1 FL=1